jgi:hypothetical protein
MMLPAALSTLTTTFMNLRDRQSALGVWAAVAGLASVRPRPDSAARRPRARRHDLRHPPGTGDRCCLRRRCRAHRMVTTNTHEDANEAHGAELQANSPLAAVAPEPTTKELEMNASPSKEPKRILVVGRSPSVLVNTVEILRSKGYSADATNQFDRVLDDYDAEDIDVVAFGGMVPAETKQHLRQEICERNAHVTFVQGLAGIAGLIASQVESVITAGEPDDSHVVYDREQRSVHLTLHKAARVTVEAWWATSVTPPEPKSTSNQVLGAELGEGSHSVALPATVPSVASFLTVTVGSAVRTFTVGAMPQSVMSMVPTGGSSDSGSPSASSQLPPVSEVNTRSHDR